MGSSEIDGPIDGPPDGADVERDLLSRKPARAEGQEVARERIEQQRTAKELARKAPNVMGRIEKQAKEQAAGRQEAERMKRRQRLRDTHVERLAEIAGSAKHLIDAAERSGTADRDQRRREISARIRLIERIRDEQGREALAVGGNQARRLAAEVSAAAERGIADLQQLDARLQREQLAEERHLERVPGLVALNLDSTRRMVVTFAVRSAAAVVTDHLSPGDNAVAARAAEALMHAAEAPEKLDVGAVHKLAAPVLVVGGRICLDIESTQCRDEERHDGRPVKLGLGFGPGGDLRQFQPRAQVGPERPAPELDELSSAEAAGPTVSAAVLLGAAEDIVAAGSGVVDGDGLLSYARKAIFGRVFDKMPSSVLLAMNAVRGLELIIFVDPALRCGLWVDVDPATQQPASVLLIEMAASDTVLDDVQLFELASL